MEKNKPTVTHPMYCVKCRTMVMVSAPKKIVMKRFRPRAKGRAAPILKPWSTVTIILSEVKQMESHGSKS